MTSGASAVSQMTDGQPQAATTAGAVSQISDHVSTFLALHPGFFCWY